ncbi:hypothetical protein [Pseudolabrys sp.]|uniref:hypothetical protein n=1 Tax=Pseudolabrys sp. TaxID=1960880 RepID=UPI003D0E0E13
MGKLSDDEQRWMIGYFAHIHSWVLRDANVAELGYELAEKRRIERVKEHREKLATQ